MGTTGARILLNALLAEGVDTMFGYPGAALLPFLDLLYEEPLRFILTRHEQGAAHMADGYARATGRTGVCMATSGPGATNLTTGIATANMDSTPMVAITGQVKTHLIGNDAFQEADITGIMRPITKHAFLVKDVRDLARTVREAFHLARTGRPGPVVIDLPVDVTMAECNGEADTNMCLPGYRPKAKGHPGQIRRAAEAVNASERPILYAGGGVIASGAAEELRALAETANLPVTMTLMGLGALPGDHSLSLGMLGMHGTPAANHAVMESDLIVAIGARFDDRVTGPAEIFAPHARIVHIDIDPTSISKNIRVDIPVVGDARSVLRAMLPHVRGAERAAWFDQIERWRRENPLGWDRDDGEIKPQEVIRELCRLTPDDAIIATEVGQHQMWTALFYTVLDDGRALSAAGEDHRPQQRPPRPRAPVAGAVLRPALQPDRTGGQSGFRAGGRSLRRDGAAPGRPRRDHGQAGGDAADGRAGAARRMHRAGGECLPHGARRAGDQSDDRRDGVNREQGTGVVEKRKRTPVPVSASFRLTCPGLAGARGR